MMTEAHVRNLIEQLDMEKCIENSFNNYHTEGLLYVNLLRSEDLTIKLYFLFPEVIKLNKEGYLVKPHNHAYNFTTQVLFGSIRHIIFEESEGLLKPVDEIWNKHLYEWDKPKNERLTSQGKTFMREVSNIKYHAGTGYEVNTDEIHSLITTDEPTCLLLHQYTNKIKNGTYLYDQETDIDFSNTYEKFERHEIMGLLNYLKSQL